jgi:magnesium transporter
MSELRNGHPADGTLDSRSPRVSADVLADLSPDEAAELAGRLDPLVAGRVLAELHPRIAATIVSRMEPPKASKVLALMRPDDRVDVLEEIPPVLREQLMRQMPASDAEEVRRLQQYPPDTAAGIMTTEVTALPEVFTVNQAIADLRLRREEQEPVYYAYTVDGHGRLAGVLSMRDLILSSPTTALSQLSRHAVAVTDDTDQEDVARLLRKHGYMALPVVDGGGRLLGIITADDVADVVEEEATEDIQKLGGSAALDAPYLSVGFVSMLRKRGPWLTVLFVGEMLTATAMGYFEHQIARAVLLSLFVPLIISSGGNSGSQAATIVVRSLALGELTIRDWWGVFLREARTGLTLGAWLGLVAFLRIAAWQYMGWFDYGPHHLLLGLAVGASVTGVITVGSVTGSLLPIALRRVGLDPATSSAPFVATIVDVTGIVIYFWIAALVLQGTML